MMLAVLVCGEVCICQSSSALKSAPTGAEVPVLLHLRSVAAVAQTVARWCSQDGNSAKHSPGAKQLAC